MQSDGKVLLAGNFTTVNGAARSNIARLNSDGSLDTSYSENPATLLQGGIVDIPNGGGKTLAFAAIPAFVYQVETSGDLTAGTPLGSFTAGADGRLIITGPGATGGSRFYRFNK